MKITGVYSHKSGLEYIEKNHPDELKEIYMAIGSLDIDSALSKKSAEKSKPPLIFSPVDMNNQIKYYCSNRGWTELAPETKKGFREPRVYLEEGREFREMDGIKNKVGLEIQFGKYAFMGYDIFSKMPIFHNRGLIDCGIELVVMHSMIPNMSTGVSSFNQITMDMRARGEADIDLPTLILGFEPTPDEWAFVEDKRKRFKAGEQVKLNGLSGSKPGPKNN